MNLDKLQNWLISTNNDVAYISDPISINYFTGYSMDPHERIFALLAFKDKAAFIFAPELNVEEAKNSAWDEMFMAILITKIHGQKSLTW